MNNERNQLSIEDAAQYDRVLKYLLDRSEGKERAKRIIENVETGRELTPYEKAILAQAHFICRDKERAVSLAAELLISGIPQLVLLAEALTGIDDAETKRRFLSATSSLINSTCEYIQLYFPLSRDPCLQLAISTLMAIPSRYWSGSLGADPEQSLASLRKLVGYIDPFVRAEEKLAFEELQRLLGEAESICGHPESQ